MKFNSIKFKISVLYVAILGAILIIYSAFLYFSLRYTLYDELDNELNKKAKEMASTIDSYVNVLGHQQEEFMFAVKRAITLEGDYPYIDKLSELENQWLQKVDKLDLKDDFINFLNIKGESLVKSSNFQTAHLALIPKELKNIQEGNPIFKSIKFEKRNLRIISTPFSYGENERYIIQVGTSLKPVINLLQARLLHIAISIPAILLLAGFGGRIFASRILRPVVEITKTASNITHEDLSSRVKAEHVDEEMRYLVNSFNDMISRLEKSFRYIAEFSSQVSHELKTPLAIIKGESEIALRKDRSLEEYKRVIKTTQEEAERMLKITEDLLLLTRLDYRPEFFKFEHLDFVEFFKEIYEQSKILASKKNIKINMLLPQRQMYINADRLHLKRLFFNLISNAIKFNFKNGRLDIDVGCKDKKAIVSISDTGIGISEEDLPKIFDRFFYVKKAGQDIEPSTGLGLSIAQSIANIHYGTISAESKLGQGSTFNVALPLSQ